MAGGMLRPTHSIRSDTVIPREGSSEQFEQSPLLFRRGWAPQLLAPECEVRKQCDLPKCSLRFGPVPGSAGHSARP